MTQNLYGTQNLYTPQRRPQLADLMHLCRVNYILLSAAQQCLRGDERLLKDEPMKDEPVKDGRGYTLQIDRGWHSCYTADVLLHYRFWRRRQGRKTVVPIVCFKVRLYLDTRHAAVIFSKSRIARVLPVLEPCLSFQSRWYYNSCLKIVLSRFLTVDFLQ